ncbi:MAG: hypothetical protein SF123_22140 [Chloroflexota bacterium]|nr:hypothetical protein [Chloroflexota bacterium]
MDMKLRGYVDADGVLRLEVPTAYVSRDVIVTVSVEPVVPIELDAMGYPIGYFEQTYGSIPDFMIEDEEAHPVEKASQ